MTARAKLIAAAAGAALLLTGCAAGQRAQTSVEVPVVDGVQASVGAIDLRALTIVTPANGSYPSGGSAALQLYIVNNGAPDQLVSVSSSAAKAATLSTSAATEFSIPPSAAPSSSSSAAQPAIPLASGETTVVGVAAADPQITLKGLDAALYPAMSIPVTFTFATAGSVTVQVSVHLSTGPVNAPTLATSHDTDDD